MQNNTGHDIVAEKILQQFTSGQEISMRKAAEESGYAPQHSSKIASAESFQRSLFFKIPFDVLADVQAKQLDAKRVQHMIFYGCEDEDEVQEIVAAGYWEAIKIYQDPKGRFCGWVIKPDWEQIDRALDKVYKLTGLYKAEKIEISTPMEDLTDEELEGELIEEGQMPALPQAEAKTVE